MNLEGEFECYSAIVKALTEIEGGGMIPEATIAYRALVDGLSALRGYAEEVKDTQKRGEFMRIVGELSYALGEANLRLAELREESNELQKEIEVLRRPEINLIRREGFYYDTEDETIPFCPNCYISSRKLRILSREELNISGIEYRCPECNWKGFQQHTEAINQALAT